MKHNLQIKASSLAFVLVTLLVFSIFLGAIHSGFHEQYFRARRYLTTEEQYFQIDQAVDYMERGFQNGISYTNLIWDITNLTKVYSMVVKEKEDITDLPTTNHQNYFQTPDLALLTNQTIGEIHHYTRMEENWYDTAQVDEEGTTNVQTEGIKGIDEAPDFLLTLFTANAFSSKRTPIRYVLWKKRGLSYKKHFQYTENVSLGQ